MAPALTLKRRLVPLVGAYVVIMSVYVVVAFATLGTPLHALPTAVDEAVGFSPPWVVVYAAVYFQALAPVCALSNVRVLDRTIAGYLSIYLVAVPLWVLYPVGVPREPLAIHDVWTYGIALVRALDPPSNCLPSMHVAFATLAALVVRRHDPAAGWVLLGSAALISWSTLAINQHWFVDCALGAGLAVLADHLWLSKVPPHLFRPIPRHWHGLWFGAYALGVLVLMSGWWLGWVPVSWLTERALLG